MAYQPSYDTDDSAVPAAVRIFLKRRLFEVAGVVLFLALIAASLSLASWSVDDPSLNHALDRTARNWLGYPGAVIADELMQFFGLGVLVLLAIPMRWAVGFLAHEGLPRPLRQSFAWLLCAFSASATLAALPAPASWSLTSGLGGNAGDVIHNLLMMVLSVAISGWIPTLATGLFMLAVTLFFGLRALGMSRAAAVEQAVAAPSRSRKLLRATGAGLGLGFGYAREMWSRWRELRRAEAQFEQQGDADDIIRRLAPQTEAPRRGRSPLTARIEPTFSARRPAPPMEEMGEDAAEAFAEEEVYEEDGYAAEAEYAEEEAYEEEEEAEDEAPAPKVTRTHKPLKQGKRLKKDMQPGLGFGSRHEYELPPLTLLAEPKRVGKPAELSDEALEQNARMLEGVLDDFGVKGQILKVRPGPAVTLYELEPAPGIKSSRVISLADDIARSMSAISARVAVVQGRNAIGIELPNAKRETVFLREMLGSEAFEKTNLNLAIALGKNIGGEPVFADLARMPHLLIAGTTGSGKSVGINTMILSLLYRLPPERCKLIMIDPKMLELSVYEGIPHLLAPVVTDPRKAVVALKWAVREMEERYRKMSKVGVRNIDGYNARMKQAAQKGEELHRTVQTGFDPETGEPVFEKEAMDLSPMPYIVVIIDEMADLMMVAGKDIEGAVQRLAQMARAAGIHVVMATQRPSVDVITGTIKANFPTRISFQVTSKIDSRTILGEQGAEQLLGQGDMLYMAGGGRISRLHGPFVADDEVEKIVAHLKAQGDPQYVEAVTEEPDEAFGEGGVAGGEGGGSGDDLYDQAVQVVLRDKKVSTSYVQRRLQIGYNKAASLIERMEREGLISAANATGKREILVPGDSARD
ncbi:cell division protein FtsK [Aestuariivirga litoralis]|uniref:DNA translocase FtsK n=1 Tax=Aestuariivirga litoralis TaxID=2650924 RepID=A0A2W2CAS4_9HYPH|nr:DNA translocase FtsK [Aestuariivirga litoralis]PZF77293.1 cell division protein FtsK [Aestuariivirga litoralis]